MTSALNKLELRVLVDPEAPNWPQIQVLIDGEELLSTDEYTGYDPEKLLSDESPLFVATPARRTALYLCTCGEPGCASIAPLIERKGDRVLWSDFRNYVGVYVDPTDEPYPNASWGRPIKRKDIEFAATEYEAELKRAIADRSWETPQRKIARSVSELLTVRSDEVTTLGFEFEKAWPTEGDKISISLRRNDEQFLLEYATDGLEHATAGNRIVEALLTADVNSWPVIWTSGRPWPR